MDRLEELLLSRLARVELGVEAALPPVPCRGGGGLPAFPCIVGAGSLGPWGAEGVLLHLPVPLVLRKFLIDRDGPLPVADTKPHVVVPLAVLRGGGLSIVVAQKKRPAAHDSGSSAGSLLWGSFWVVEVGGFVGLEGRGRRIEGSCTSI